MPKSDEAGEAEEEEEEEWVHGVRGRLPGDGDERLIKGADAFSR